MKIFCLMLLAFTLALTVNAQTKTFEALEKENKSFKKDRSKITYDKFKDVTNVVSSMSPLSIGTTLIATFDFKGQVLSEPVKSYFVAITTISLMRDTSLIFIANGERVSVGKAVSSNERTKIMSGLMDVYMHLYEFTPEQLEKFASAEKVEFQIGSDEFGTRKDTSEKLKNLLALSKLK
jgi:cold shock CspA family protein